MNCMRNCCCEDDAIIEKYTWKDFDFVSADTVKDFHVHQCKIQSSHNTSLGDFQMFDKCNIDIIMNALNLNFRMLELDLFENDATKEILVSHGFKNTTVTGCLSFIDCLNVIHEYAWKCTDLPLFLVLETSVNSKRFFRNIDTLLETTFQSRLPSLKGKLKNYTIKELRNKIIILTTFDGLKWSSGCLYGKNRCIINKSHKSKFLDEETEGNDLYRIYPANTLVSSNYDFTKFASCQFVCINIGYRDKYFYQYLDYFDKKGIIPL